MECQISAAGLEKKVSRMLVRNVCLVVFLIGATVPAARAQISCAPGSAAAIKLSCLIPNAVTPSGSALVTSPTNANSQLGNSFGFLTSDVGGELSQIPLASPASGIIFTTDPTLHVPVPSDQSLGPILTQRSDTIGKHKLYVAGTYQYFLLQDVDGISLNNLPSTFFFSSTGGASADTLGVTNGILDLKIHQFVGYATFGLTDRIDVSVAVPLLRVQMRYTDSEVLYKLNNPSVPVGSVIHNSLAQQATGIGDIVLAFKDNVWKLKRGGGFAFGAEFRLPTGDAQNFLGSGAYGLKPFGTFTYGAVVSPHLNIGYQINSASQLVFGSGGYPRLPNRLIYSGGADWRVARRLTVAADVLEQRVFNAPRATLLANPFLFPTSSGSSAQVPSAISTTFGDYNRTDGSIGVKIKPYGNLLVTGNVIIRADDGGLRTGRVVPLAGISYTF
ncbi:MAG: hypothetical protein ABSA96_20535 [Candidatus Acidiferrales bacterium]|jgi:hypothetical protein